LLPATSGLADAELLATPASSPSPARFVLVVQLGRERLAAAPDGHARCHRGPNQRRGAEAYQ